MRSSSGPAETPARNHFIELEFDELEAPELPIPRFFLTVSRGAARYLEEARKIPAGLLSKREQEVARRLAAGETRPRIASALGLKPSTVASTSKRIYAKLGIHSRTELARRMKQT